jgi:hypothetical protein
MSTDEDRVCIRRGIDQELDRKREQLAGVSLAPATDIQVTRLKTRARESSGRHLSQDCSDRRPELLYGFKSSIPPAIRLSHGNHTDRDRCTSPNGVGDSGTSQAQRYYVGEADELAV